MKEINVRYQNQGDYQLPCIETKEHNESHIGVWANRHRQYLKQHHRIKYYNLLTSERRYSYLADIEKQAQTMFLQLVKAFAEKENVTVDKSTFAEETTQPTTAETATEKASKEPIFSQTTTANTEPKQDTHTQTEPPKSEKSEHEITTNTVSEVTTAIEQIEEFDINYWIFYAQNYARSIGLALDETATECWDNPISANANNENIGTDIEGRLNRYKNIEGFTSVWIWAEKISDTQYEIYIGYA